MSPVWLLLAFGVHHPRICIDPGHPSEVGPGTRGKHLTEIRAAWLVSKQLAKKLRADGYFVKLTKSSEDQFVKNRKRAQIANSFKADLLVRLHCDSSTKSGFAVYYPDRKGSAAGYSGPSDKVIEQSTLLSHKFFAAFTKVIGSSLVNNGLMPDIKTAVGSKQGALTGSIFSQVPVLLVEMVTLTQPSDEAFLANTSSRRKMVQALERGVLAAVPLRQPRK